MIGIEVEIAQSDTVRLVTNADLREQSLRPLYDEDEEYADLVSLEYSTHGRLSAEAIGLPDLDAGELAHGVPYSRFINATFSYRRNGGNRFSNEERGAWYCGFDVATSLEEVRYHLTRFLQEAGRFDNTTDYRELFADFIGKFRDLSDVTPQPKCLHPDIEIGYPAGQVLAQEVRLSTDASGIVYPSVRNEGGKCLAALRPAAVQNVRQGDLWRLTWSGSPEPTIEQNPTA